MQQECDSLDASQSEGQLLLLSNNMSEVLQGEYYQKFKLGQNLYEQSMTMSRLSNGDRTLDENNTNNTYVRMVQNQERLSTELCRNQALENRLRQLEEQLNNSFKHNQILQGQLESQQQALEESEKKKQKLQKNLEIEKLLNSQLMKKLNDQQEIITTQQKQLALHSQKSSAYYPIQRKPQLIAFNSTLSQLNRNHNQKTEDSTFKDTSSSDLKSQDLNKAAVGLTAFGGFGTMIDSRASRTSQYFWSPEKSTSKMTLERRIEATMAQIKNIKMQFQQYKHNDD